MHVGTALAVRCNARAASATDLRARYLAPLARCALLPTWRVTTTAVDLFTASLLFTAARTRPCIATTRLQCATSCCACTLFIAARTYKHCPTKANACRRWCTPETGQQTRGHMHRAPHHSACEHCAGRAVQRSCGKCNRSARSLPGAAGPVRPAANTATAMVHTTFTPDQMQWALAESDQEL